MNKITAKYHMITKILNLDNSSKKEIQNIFGFWFYA